MEKPEQVKIEWLSVKPERAPTAREPRWWWRGYYYVGRETRHVTLGRATREEVVAQAAAFVAKGKPRDSVRVAPVEANTVRDVCELWLGYQEARMEAGQLAPRSFAAYRAAVVRLVSSRRAVSLGDYRTDDLTDARVDDYALARARTDAPKTVNDDLSILQMALKWGRRRGLAPLIELEPARLADRPVRPSRTPTAADLARLVPHLPPRYALLVELMLATGARVGEVAALEWEDCDLEACVLILGRHRGACKTGAREVPIASELAEALNAWRARPAERPARGAPVPASVRDRWVVGVRPVTAVSALVSRHLPAACEAAGVERFTSHGFRRLVSDELGRSGVEPAVAASVLGHSPEMMVRRYRRPTLEDRRLAVRRSRLGSRPLRPH